MALARRSAAVLLAGVVALAGPTSCSSSSGDDGSGSALGTALGRIPDTANTRSYVTFGRPSAAVAANAGRLTGDGPYGSVVGYGFDDLAPLSQILPTVLDLAPADAVYAASAGTLPHSGGLLAGLSLTGFGSRAVSLGAKATHSGSVTTYRFAADDSNDPNGTLARKLNTLTPFNVVTVDGRDLHYGRAAADLSLTSATSHPLGADPAVRLVAGCLDDPLAAILTDKVPARRPVGPPGATPTPTATAGVRLLGIGVSGSKGAKPTEQLCIAADSGRDASSIGASVRTALTSGTSQVSRSRWSTILTRPDVTVRGMLVTVTTHPVNGVGGQLFRSFTNGDLPGLTG